MTLVRGDLGGVVTAEAAVATSSVNVVTNANLLRWVKVKPEYAQK